MENGIRLMTHNVWNCDTNKSAWEEIGEDCSAAVRVKGIVQVYLDTMPDVIGGQEVSAKMADLINENCHEAGVDYVQIWGRFTPIWYRADKFELVDSAFGAYPEHIDGLEGSFNDYRTKSWNLGVFRVKESGKQFIFATTHLWWKTTDESRKGEHCYQAFSDEARQFQIALLAGKLEQYRKKYGCPVVLVGDLNTDYRSKAVKWLLENGYRHCHDIATQYADHTVGYHACFPTGYDAFYSDAPFEEGIDHIFLCGEGEVVRFARHSPEYYLPISDHSAAYIDLQL